MFEEKKITFSKIMFSAILIITALVIIYSCVIMWVYADLTPLGYLIPSVFAECAVVSGFYSYKAKAENEIKLDIERQKIQRQMNNDAFMEDN